jgi:penicillin V acylase-like amidase (Ntn superfamily)
MPQEAKRMSRGKVHLCFFLLIVSLFRFDIWPLGACTAFCLRNGQRIVLGKNLDWPIGEGLVVVNRRNLSKTAFVDSSEIPLKWISKYGSVTFNQFGVEFPLGGMNEAGLVIEELSYPLAGYAEPDKRPVVNEFQWTQYQLDTHATVKEVLESNAHLRVSRAWFGLHYLICDRFGDVAIVEFLDGDCITYTGESLPVEVLSNNTYAESIRYLRFHKGFGGDTPIRPGTGSSQRFVWAASMLKEYASNPSTSADQYAFSILDSVRQEDTQWSIVYDTGPGIIRFTTLHAPQIHSIEFDELDFDCHEPSLVFDMLSLKSGSSSEVNMNGSFVTFEPEMNRRLLQAVFFKLYESGQSDQVPQESLMDSLVKYTQSVKCMR